VTGTGSMKLVTTDVTGSWYVHGTWFLFGNYTTAGPCRSMT